MINNLLVGISRLSVKMRILKTHYGAGTDVAELNDRQVLILEILADQSPMSVSDLAKKFKGVAQSTISADIKALRAFGDGFVEIQLGQQDMRKHMVTLTNLGHQKVTEIRNQRAETYAPLVKALPTDAKKAQVVDEIVNNTIRLIDEVLASLDNDKDSVSGRKRRLPMPEEERREGKVCFLTK